MRVTSGMIINRMIMNLNRNLSRLAKVQNQMSTGKIVARPSDDPSLATQGIRLQRELSQTKQYQANANDAQSLLDLTDTALTQIENILQRAKELAVAGANGTNPQEAREAYAAEIDQLKEQLVQIGNTAVGGRYIFAGTNYTTPPFVLNNGAVDYAPGFTGEMVAKIPATGTQLSLQPNIAYEVGPNVTVPVNLTAAQVFNLWPSSTATLYDPPALPLNKSMFAVLENLSGYLRSGNTGKISGESLKDIDDQLDHILTLHADVGARQNRIAQTLSRLADAETNLTELLSKTTDIDLAEATIRYSNEQAVYQAALMTGAKIIQPTLADYLR